MILYPHVRNGVSYTLLSAAIALFTLHSCSTPEVARLEDVQPLPSEVPEELQRKFEVRELTPETDPSASPSPVPSASASEKKSSRGKRSAKSAKKPESAAPAASAGSKSAGKEIPKTKTFEYPSRRPAKDPIWVGEKMVLEVTFFGMVAGEMTLRVLPHKVVNDRKVYHLHGNAKSSKVFKVFYTLDDVIESYYDYDGLFSHRFHMLLNQSRQNRDAVELYDHDKKQVFYWSRKNHVSKGYSEVKEYKEIVPFTQDSFSALYYARMLPLEVGKKYKFPVVSEGRLSEANLTVVRKEVIESPMGKVRTIVVKPEMAFQGVLKKRGDSFIWLTDDDRRIVVRLEAKVKVGTVVAHLKSFEKGEPPKEEEAPPAEASKEGK